MSTNLPDPPTDDRFTVDQAAKASGVTESQIRYALRSGKLAGTRVGPRCVLISRLDLAAWLSDPSRG
jgi:excisionase family DNA binding protein